MQKKYIIINGPNLNLIGTREPEIYGDKSFDFFLKNLQSENINYQIDYFQSNVEGLLIDKIHEVGFNYDGIILNAGAYTHTSIAIADAIKSITTKTIEVHISNIDAREDFRRTSVISPACIGCISGFGLKSYALAIKAFE